MKVRSIVRAPYASMVMSLLMGACVEHRPVRNGLDDVGVYLAKTALTQPNPKIGGTADDGWLYKVTVVAASSPNVVADYAFPGLQSDATYVRFRFQEQAMQIVDARSLQEDEPGNPNDDLSTQTELVLMEFSGKNVDVKLRENLDGERTNLLEENTEEPWEKRQKFKVDLEESTHDPVASMAWFYGEFIQNCAKQHSAHLVPGSFEWDPSDQYLSWVVEVNYGLTLDGACYDMLSLTHDVGTATIHYRFSFYRPGESDFERQVIPEKDRINKKYGAFQVLNLFRDGETGILGAESLLQRWNPNRPTPVVFYFIEGFPDRFKPMFVEIASQTNEILTAAGAQLQFDFRDYNHDGVERHFGDIRYSFVAYHQDIGTTRGLLGYGPSSSDPRTGEVISATLNLYNVGMDFYRYYIQSFLEDHGGKHKPDANKEWEQIACEDGETVAPMTADGEVDTSGFLTTRLFEEMRRVMEIETNTGTVDDFLPEPVKQQSFVENYHRLLDEVRYVEPSYNDYVWQTTHRSALANYAERMRTEREFEEAMFEIMINEDPFALEAQSGRQAIEAQQQLIENFRRWRRNHEELEADREMLFASRNVYLFDESSAINAIARGGRQCVQGHWESDEQYSARIIEDVVSQVAIHEFGHNLGLRHNFYGSVDSLHMRENEVSSSVMDYVKSYEEAGGDLRWGLYDAAALEWIYGTESVRAQKMEEDFLFCTDQHRTRSPLCAAHDLGVTPSQIVLNSIEQYDWLYNMRNFRTYRTFWDTSSYPGRVYGSLFPLLRMWYLALFDWSGGDVQETLKRLDQLDDSREVLSPQAYDEIAEDFYNDVSRAVSITMAFYDAIVNQSASFRNYQTEFDPFYGDILRLGIVIDKLYATFAFMDMHYVYNYDPNVVTYVALYDVVVNEENMSIGSRVLDDMLGANYDTFEWFRYTALAIFAENANSSLCRNAGLKERIAIERYDNELEFDEVYGEEARNQALKVDNPFQVFEHEAEQYVYTYLPERNWHLVASASRGPISFEYMREYNEGLNADASGTLDTYGLKTLLAYHELYNNFGGL